ncbi:winged helix-turn-helix domain-containing protein [Albimonas pacifica]|uniref:Transcriptional regulatory protein, C terminal n=1 Tax=Albimonas pacifica TaxID=1114924 RepID=A0A1I3JJ32_9RHOB|nr:helix-turn-helix domain-containing protein [Albimonas pacifica]SFI60257.1 Transcriptional regulatory protein, C terminal [Albimonas pacifica]
MSADVSLLSREDLEIRCLELIERCTALEEALGLTGDAQPRNWRVPLTPALGRMLAVLLNARPGRPVSRQLLSEVSARDPLDPPLSNAVEVQIRNLRKLLRDAGLPHDAIHTVVGEGYCIHPDHLTAMRNAFLCDDGRLFG